MRGHEALIAMRRQGAVPDVVWIDTDLARLPMADDWLEVTPRHAHVQLDPADSPARVDFRCVIGLTVSISGDDLKRVRATRDACVFAGAKRVIASTTKRIGRGEFAAFQLVELTDTDGHLTHEPESVHG
jgi:hypothetical protein